jgi:hypothetical protein
MELSRVDDSMIGHAAASREALARADGFWSSWRLPEKCLKNRVKSKPAMLVACGCILRLEAILPAGCDDRRSFCSCVRVGVWMEFENPAFEWLADRPLHNSLTRTEIKHACHVKYTYAYIIREIHKLLSSGSLWYC